MDNLRLVLWFTAAALVWVFIQTWQRDFAPAAPSPAVAKQTAPATETSPATNLPAIPEQPAASAAMEVAAPATPAAESPAASPATPSQIVHVRTDVLDVEIDTRGGDLRSVRLAKYPVHKDQPDVPVQLLDPTPERLFLFHTGLRAIGGQPEPDHLAHYRVAQTEYVLPDGASDSGRHPVMGSSRPDGSRQGLSLPARAL